MVSQIHTIKFLSICFKFFRDIWEHLREFIYLCIVIKNVCNESLNLSQKTSIIG